MTTREAALEALERLNALKGDRSYREFGADNDIAALRVFIEGAEAEPHAYLWSDGKIHATPQGTLQAENTPADASGFAEREELITWLESYPLGRTEEGQAIARLLRSAPSAPPSDDPETVLRAWGKARDALSAAPPEQPEGQGTQEDTQRLNWLDSQRKWGDGFAALYLDSGDCYVRPWRYANERMKGFEKIKTYTDIRYAIDAAMLAAAPKPEER